MTTNPLEDMITRLTEMQKAVISNSDAVGDAFYAQEAPPYWLNHIDGFSVELDSEQLQIVTYRITMTLILATTTEGFNQEAEDKIKTVVPTVLLYFGKRRKLKRTNADSDVSYLDPRGAIITGGRADYGITVSGIGQSMFGVDFSIEVPMYQYTDQATF